MQLNQIELIADISSVLERKHKVKVVNIRQINAIIQAASLIVDEFSRPHVPATPRMGLSAWLHCDDTGLSSKFMACVCAGGPIAERHWPHDADDFSRCVKLLDAVPEARPNLAKLLDHGEEWRALVGAWEELEAMYRSSRIKELTERINCLLF